MRRHYYFIASLPMLVFEGEARMPVEDFLRDCQRLLSVQDYSMMKQLLSERNEPAKVYNEIFSRWVQFNGELRNELAWVRAQEAGKEPFDYIRGEKASDVFVAGIVRQAEKAADLLSAEKIIDRARWQFLDEVASGHYYDFEFLVVYGLKLRILERYKEINSSKGKEIFDSFQKEKWPAGS